MNNGNGTVTASPADVLERVADWFAEDPTRWGKGYYLDPKTGCRCVMGGVAYAVSPDDDTANPNFLNNPLGWRAVGVLTAYVVDVLEWQPADVDDDPAPPLGDWNDAPDRTVGEVIDALRGAAAYCRSGGAR